MPQYHAGQKIEATLDFVHGDRVGEVTATFVHADDPDTKLRLSGTPDQEVASEGAGYTYGAWFSRETSPPKTSWASTGVKR